MEVGGTALPGLSLAPRARVRWRLPELPDPADLLLGGHARRHRDVRARRPEVDEHGAADRRPGLQSDRDPRLRLPSACARLGRRVLEVQPGPVRGRGVLQEPGGVPEPVPDDGAGEAVQGRQVRLHRLRHGDPRAHQRGGVQGVRGRPEERGAERPPGHRRGAVQRARLRRGEDLPQTADRLRRARRPAHRPARAARRRDGRRAVAPASRTRTSASSRR